jgi:hypothetical protein
MEKMGRMRKGRGLGLVCLRLLLIATAIQGVTPDIHDVASRSLLRLLSCVSVDLQCGGDDSTPVPDVDRDEMPDEVCIPNSPTEILVRRWIGVSRLPRFAIPGQDGCSARTDVLRSLSLSSRDSAWRGQGLNHSLCRLIC